MTGTAPAPAILYLEADDEVTSVVRRLRGTDAPRIVVVSPGRSRATSSAVALRLLARAAAADGREVAVVGDALTRSLAVDAGLAAYATVDEARRWAPSDTPPAAMPHAYIHIMRGADADDTAPTLAGATAPQLERDRSADTRIAAASVPARQTGARGGRRSRRSAVAIAVAVAAVIVLGAGLAAAAILPGATVTLAPRAVQLPARTYTVTVADAKRQTGTVEAAATVTPTGTYTVAEYAIGTVTFRNWSGSPVPLPAGTLVAAGVQAFQTTEAADVPPGRLLADGRILAGEIDRQVIAMAPGPDANVPALAVDVVLSEPQASRLRAFANNDRRLVENAAPMSGGASATGTEVLQEDVDRAIAELRETLHAAVDEEVSDGDALIVTVGEPQEPSFAGVDGLVGQRDADAPQIEGTLAYDAWVIDLEALEREALDRLLDDVEAVPEGHAVVGESAEFDIGATEGSAEGARVDVTVRTTAVRVIDEAVVIERVRGLSAEDAERALADLGAATVSLWPAWVADVPQLDWRIDVSVAGTGDLPSPTPSQTR